MAERLDIVVTERGSRRVRRNIDRIGTSATATGGAVKLLRRSLGLLGGALIIGTSIRALADFSQAMSTVKAVSEATEVQFKELRDTAKDLGATTRFSATQAAEGMLFLSRAGFEANEVVAAIGPTLLLAQAGALELGRAADIASNVLKGFGLEAAETERVVDVLAKTANSANTNVEQLGAAMSFVAPAAAALGTSVETTAAAIGVLSDAGIQATRAGTGLRQIFVKLVKPTPAATQAIKDLKLSLADLDVQSRGLAPVLETLATRNVGLAEAAELVGVRQASSLLILIKNVSRLKELSQANREAAGTAKEVARIMDDNLNGALFAVKSAFEAVQIAAGDLGAESFLTNAFRNLATALRFVAKNMDDVVASLEVLIFSFALLKLPRLIGLVLSLGAAFLTNPVFAFSAAIVALTSVVTFLRDEIKLTEDGTVSLADAMTAAGQTIGESLTEAINKLGFAFDDFDDLLDTFLTNFGRGLVVLLATTNGVIQAMIALWENFPAALEEIAIKAVNAFIRVFEESLNNSRVLKFFGFEDFKFERVRPNMEKGGSIMADAFAKGFNDTLEATLLEASINRKIERATREAADRVKALAAAKPSPTAPAAAKTDVAKLTADEKTFARLLKDLRQEGMLLRLNNRERSVREALLRFEEAITGELTKKQRDLITALAEENFSLAQQRMLLNEIRGPMETYNNQIDALTALLNDGKISLEEFNNKFRDLRITLLETQTDVGSGFERGFLKAQRSMEDFASASERLITDAFQGAQDALVEFFETGKFEADDFFRQLASNFLKLGTQQLFSSAFGQGGGGGGGDFLGGITKSIGGFLTGLFGFQGGVSGMPVSSLSVGRLSGVDNRLVAFRARSDEEVSVTRRGEGDGRPLQVNFHITTPNVDSFRRSQGQLLAQTSAILSRASSRNN